MSYILKKIEMIVMYIYIFLIVAFPTSFVIIKQGISFVLLVFILFLFWKKGLYKIKIPPFLLSVFGLYIISGIFWIFIGILYNGFQAPMTRFNVYIINPIIYFVLILYSYNNFNIRKSSVLKAVEFSVLFIVLYNIFFFLVLNFLPFISPSLFPGIKYNFGGLNIGFKKITAPNLVTLAFFIPYYFVKMLSRFDWKSTTIVFLGMVSAIISARTALMLVLVLMVLLFLLLNKFIQMPIKRDYSFLFLNAMVSLIILVSVFAQKIVVSIFYKIHLSMFAKAQVGLNDNGSLIRMEQINDLIRTWTWKPMLGWGEGANSLNTIRSNVSGAYEMTYFALLMQRGVIGTVLYFLNIWIIMKRLFVTAKQGIELKQKERNLAALVGFICILFSNATNPTIQSFDGLFLFFFPVFIGVFASTHHQHKSSDTVDQKESIGNNNIEEVKKPLKRSRRMKNSN
ncbi:MAG: hypothetical protein ACRCV7_06680 [Culicoidibacterales bacterium]